MPYGDSYVVSKLTHESTVRYFIVDQQNKR